MKRIQMFLAGALIAVGSLYAQSSSEEWKAEVAKLKETVKTSPAQAEANADQLVKGKNKNNVELLVAVGQTFFDAGEIDKAQKYVSKVSSGRSVEAYVLEGDIAVAKNEPGKAAQNYEKAINLNPHYTEAYLKYADIYKGINYELSVEKLEQLKEIEPSNMDADRKLAEIYYLKNDFANAVEAYSHVVKSSAAEEKDLIQYAFALFLNHDFEKSLEVANMGLQKEPRHIVFNRLAMYNCVDLQRLDEAFNASEIFFKECEEADYTYLDYVYYGRLLEGLEKYDEAIVQYEKTIELDATYTDLYKNISSAYEHKNDYKNAIDAFKKYYQSLAAEKQTPDLLLQWGQLCYSAGTQSDSLGMPLLPVEERTAVLMEADSVFQALAEAAPDSHLGNLWRARTNSVLDPETTEGLAKPFYELVATMLESKNEPRYNRPLIECYSYLGYYYLVAIENPSLVSEQVANKEKSKEYWSKILLIDPANEVATRALEGLK